MIVQDKNINQITIKNKVNTNSLLVSVDGSACVGIEISHDDEQPPSPNFYIHKSDREYNAFLKFFQNCNRITNANILIDDCADIETATILQYSRDENYLKLRFLPVRGCSFAIFKSTEAVSYQELYPHFANLARDLMHLKTTYQSDERTL